MYEVRVPCSIKEIFQRSLVKDIKSGDPYKLCRWVEESKRDFLDERCLRFLEKAILSTNDILQIYEFLYLCSLNKVERFNRESFEKRVIESNNAKLMLYCIGFVDGINLDRMRKALYATKNITYIEALTEEEDYIERAGINEENQEALIEYNDALNLAREATGNERYFPEALKPFGGLNTSINELKEKILKEDNPYLVVELANWIEYLNKNKGTKYDTGDLDKKIVDLSDPMGIYEYLSSNEHIQDRMPHVKKLIEIGDKKYIDYTLEFAGQFLNEKEKKELENALELRSLGL